MILNKNVDIRHSKFFIYERTSFGKADGRYMAYPKVDSFLKVLYDLLISVWHTFFT